MVYCTVGLGYMHYFQSSTVTAFPLTLYTASDEQSVAGLGGVRRLCPALNPPPGTFAGDCTVPKNPSSVTTNLKQQSSPGGCVLADYGGRDLWKR